MLRLGNHVQLNRVWGMEIGVKGVHNEYIPLWKNELCKGLLKNVNYFYFPLSGVSCFIPAVAVTMPQ